MKQLLYTLLLSPMLVICSQAVNGQVEDDPIVKRYMVTDVKKTVHQVLPSLETTILKKGTLDSPNSTTNGTRTHFYPYRDYLYQSFDEKLDTINLSARMMWAPNSVSKTQKDIILYCPFTHCAANECVTGYASFPGQSEQSFFIWKPNWVVMADGQGFGWSRSHQQMYLNHWLWARQMVDALRAAFRQRQQMMETDGAVAGVDYPVLADGWKTVICGMSQGGGTAMATLRIMETTLCDPRYETDCTEGQTLADYYHVDMANVCCGPYNPKTTMETYFTEWYSMHYPCAIALTMRTLFASYPEIMGDLSDEDIYTEEYMTSVKPELDRALDSKNVNAAGINAIFLKHLAHKYHSWLGGSMTAEEVYASEFIRPDVIDMSSVAAQKLMQCLEYNNVFRDGWTPKSWVKYWFSKEDEVVPFSSSKELMKTVGDNGSGFESTYWYHEGCCIRWMATDWTERNYLTSSSVETKSAVYYVGDADALQDALSENQDEYKEIYLTADIDLSEIKEPFGYDYTKHQFWGMIDGQGYTLKNLAFGTAYKDTNYMGLVGSAGSNRQSDKASRRTTFRNLVIEDFEMSGSSYVGLLCGYADYCNFEHITINIDRSRCSGRVFSNSNYVGNIVGWADNSNFNDITINGTGYVYSDATAYSAYAGGICGYAENCQFFGCTNHTNVYSQKDCTGGIVGAMKNSTINSCEFDGIVSSAGEKVNVGSGMGYTGALAGEVISGKVEKLEGYCSIRNSLASCMVVNDGSKDASLTGGSDCYYSNNFFSKSVNDNHIRSYSDCAAEGDLPTAIENVNSDADCKTSDAPVYDLSGCRLISPRKGQIIIRNGKKQVYAE